jgi:hypothetical protein
VPNLAYVTGTGAHDHIRLTVSPTDPDEVIVTVVPYYNAARTIPTFRDGVPFDFSYTLRLADIGTLLADTEGLILVDAGQGDDLIEIDAQIAADFRLQRPIGVDEIRVLPSMTHRLRSLRVEGTPDYDAPRVVNVVIESSGEGSSVDMAARVANGTPQLQNLALPGADLITVFFGKPVSPAAVSDLRLSPLLKTFATTDLQPVGVTTAPDGKSATWTLPTGLGSDFYTLRLSGLAGLADGFPLDGEWANPTQWDQAWKAGSLKTGDGAAGGEFQFVFSQLLADFNVDNVIDLLDLAVIGANFGITPALFSQGDANADGVVDLLDLALLGVDFGQVLTALAMEFDADSNLVIDETDRAAFLARLSSGEQLTDLNGDGLFDALDETAFDAYFAGLNFA